MNDYSHIMVDIETLSNKSHAVITSLGAVQFDINTGKTSKEFYKNISIQSCLDRNLRVNESTIMWWLQQSEKAKKAISQNPEPLIDVLEYFAAFIESCGGQNCSLWGNSARFDLGILENAYHALRLESPWSPWKEKCVRTLASIYPEIKKKACEENKGVSHNALDDCLLQIKYCSEIWKKIKQ